MPVGQSARPGPWRNRNAPYGVGIMDAVTLPGLTKLSIKKPAQVGVSEFARNVIGCLAVHDPDPVLLVLPNEVKGKEIIGERIIPFFNKTAVLAELHTGIARDQKLSFVRLANGFTLWLGWSGSATSLASHPIRMVVNDEVNKFASYAGREADPVALAEQRVKTYEERALIINISSPTTSEGTISTLLDSADVVLHYWLPCPHCGARFQLTWDTVRWEKPEGLTDRKLATFLEQNKAAWYVCPHCEEKITETMKPRMVRAGFWASDDQMERGDDRGQQVASGAILLNGLDSVRHLGMELESFVCMWVKCWNLAAKFVRVRQDPSELMDFVNSDLGRDFEQQVASSKPDVYAAKCRVSWPSERLPAWTGRLIATADVQKDHFWAVIRAWGPDLRSRRIWHGRINAPPGDRRGWVELWRRCFEVYYPFEGGDRAPMCCDAVGVDSAYRSDEAYTFAITDPRVYAMRGVGRAQANLVAPRSETYRPPGEGRSPYDVYYNLMDTGRLKDWLAAAIGARIHIPGDGGELIEAEQWELNAENDPVYNRQMAAEHKIIQRRGNAQPVERWIPKRNGAPNHYWDCEYMQRAVARILQVELLDYSGLRPVAASPGPLGTPTTPDGRPFLVTQR